METVKFYVHKSCSCQQCKSKKTKSKHKAIERTFRRKSKVKISNGDYEIEKNNSPYLA